jgi:uncharacterized protein YrzB (UPF0473 family)
MKYYLITFLSVCVFTACQLGECGSDIRLGEYQLAEESKQYIPYIGNEILVFIDEKGVEHKLSSTKGLVLTETRSIARTICDNGLLDNQQEYYDSQREEIVFIDSLGNQIFFFDLLTYIENDENKNSYVIYDFLLVDSGINGNFNGQIRIVTKERDNQLTSTQRNELNLSEFIGDTILYDMEFSNVYKGKVSENRNIYYNKEKGVVAFEISIDQYWVLIN